MGTKDRTVSFRVDGDRFETLREMADERDLSLSSMFREYVDEIVAHDGHVEIVPERGVREEADAASAEFPPTVQVPQGFVREHERLELECEHLREQLDECQAYATHLEAELEAIEERNEGLVRLEDVDYEAGTSLLIE
jgi:hypothetical protein